MNYSGVSRFSWVIIQYQIHSINGRSQQFTTILVILARVLTPN